MKDTNKYENCGTSKGNFWGRFDGYMLEFVVLTF